MDGTGYHLDNKLCVPNLVVAHVLDSVPKTSFYFNEKEKEGVWNGAQYDWTLTKCLSGSHVEQFGPGRSCINDNVQCGADPVIDQCDIATSGMNAVQFKCDGQKFWQGKTSLGRNEAYVDRYTSCMPIKKNCDDNVDVYKISGNKNISNAYPVIGSYLNPINQAPVSFSNIDKNALPKSEKQLFSLPNISVEDEISWTLNYNWNDPMNTEEICVAKTTNFQCKEGFRKYFNGGTNYCIEQCYRNSRLDVTFQNYLRCTPELVGANSSFHIDFHGYGIGYGQVSFPSLLITGKTFSSNSTTGFTSNNDSVSGAARLTVAPESSVAQYLPLVIQFNSNTIEKSTKESKFVRKKLAQTGNPYVYSFPSFTPSHAVFYSAINMYEYAIKLFDNIYGSISAYNIGNTYGKKNVITYPSLSLKDPKTNIEMTEKIQMRAVKNDPLLIIPRGGVPPYKASIISGQGNLDVLSSENDETTTSIMADVDNTCNSYVGRSGNDLSSEQIKVYSNTKKCPVVKKISIGGNQYGEYFKYTSQDWDNIKDGSIVEITDRRGSKSLIEIHTKPIDCQDLLENDSSKINQSGIYYIMPKFLGNLLDSIEGVNAKSITRMNYSNTIEASPSDPTNMTAYSSFCDDNSDTSRVLIDEKNKDIYQCFFNGPTTLPSWKLLTDNYYMFSSSEYSNPPTETVLGRPSVFDGIPLVNLYGKGYAIDNAFNLMTVQMDYSESTNLFYWIDSNYLNKYKPFAAFCDMNQNHLGGGWTLAMRNYINDSNNSSNDGDFDSGVNGSDPWTNSSYTLNDSELNSNNFNLTSSSTTNSKYDSYNKVSFNEVMLYFPQKDNSYGLSSIVGTNNNSNSNNNGHNVFNYYNFGQRIDYLAGRIRPDNLFVNVDPYNANNYDDPSTFSSRGLEFREWVSLFPNFSNHDYTKKGSSIRKDIVGTSDCSEDYIFGSSGSDLYLNVLTGQFSVSRDSSFLTYRCGSSNYRFIYRNFGFNLRSSNSSIITPDSTSDFLINSDGITPYSYVLSNDFFGSYQKRVNKTIINSSATSASGSTTVCSASYSCKDVKVRMGVLTGNGSGNTSFSGIEGYGTRTNLNQMIQFSSSSHSQTSNENSFTKVAVFFRNRSFVDTTNLNKDNFDSIIPPVIVSPIAVSPGTCPTELHEIARKFIIEYQGKPLGTYTFKYLDGFSEATSKQNSDPNTYLKHNYMGSNVGYNLTVNSSFIKEATCTFTGTDQ